jgi:hypothetical protein
MDACQLLVVAFVAAELWILECAVTATTGTCTVSFLPHGCMTPSAGLLWPFLKVLGLLGSCMVRCHSRVVCGGRGPLVRRPGGTLLARRLYM